MHPMKLPRIPPAVSGLSQPAAVAAPQRPEHIVLAVHQEHVLLLRIARKRKSPRGSLSQRFLAHKEFLHELPLLCKNLNPVVGAVAHVHKPVVRNAHAMDWISKLLVCLARRVIRSRIGVAWHIPVRTPHPLVRTRLRIEHNEPLVPVAVGYEYLVRLLIDLDSSRPPEHR